MHGSIWIQSAECDKDNVLIRVVILITNNMIANQLINSGGITPMKTDQDGMDGVWICITQGASANLHAATKMARRPRTEAILCHSVLPRSWFMYQGVGGKGWGNEAITQAVVPINNRG